MYPEEKKSIRDSPSKRRAKREQSKPCFMQGVAGAQYGHVTSSNRTPWNRWPKSMRAAYVKLCVRPRDFLIRPGDGKLPTESGVTTLQG